MQETTTQLQAEPETILESLKAYFQEFIEILPGIGLGILIIVIGVLIASWVGGFFRKRITTKTKDPLMSRFLGKAIRVTLIIIAVMLGLNAAGLGAIAAGILTAAGASANIKAKDELTLDVNLKQAGGAVALTKQYKAKAKSAGEDIISPMIEQAAQAIVDLVSK